MSSAMEPLELYKRQFVVDNSTDPNSGDDFNGGWWWSADAYPIKWAIIAALFFLFAGFMVGGYMHARRRMKKGLAPLKYHRWMIPHHQRLAFYAAHPHIPNPYPAPRYAFYTPGVGEHGGSAYGMGNYPPPPPAYGQQDDFVPPYPGKTAPDQRTTTVQETGVTSETRDAERGTAPTSHPGGDLGARHIP